MSLDPAEFHGGAAGMVRDEILRNLRGIPPEISFYPESITEAAEEILAAANYDHSDHHDVGGEG
jgi:hypothetical protein